MFKLIKILNTGVNVPEIEKIPCSTQLALDAGIGVSFWTVNTLEDAKMLYDMGVRYIESDILCK